MPHDVMTPLERSAAYAAGKPIDRLPTVPIVGNTAARIIGCRVSELRNNGPLIAKAQVAAYRLFGYDNIRIFTDLYTLVEAMGARVTQPDDETAYLAAPAISDPSQIATLRPADPHRDGQLPQFLEAMRIAVGEVGAEVPITGALSGPFTTAALLVGAEQLVRLTVKEPHAVHQACEIALEAGLKYADAMIDIGCTPSLTCAMSSSTVISPKAFEQFSYPYLKRLITHIHGRGRKVTLHICGRTHRIWNLMADAGADCLSIDNEADLGAARQGVGDRVRLMGNVRPSEVMLQGTPGDVGRAVAACVRQAWDSPKGYVIASGCSLPTETPVRNIHAMMDAARVIGWPVKVDEIERKLSDVSLFA